MIPTPRTLRQIVDDEKEEKDLGAGLAAGDNDTGSSPTETASEECECGHGWHLHSSAGCMAMWGAPTVRVSPRSGITRLGNIPKVKRHPHYE